MIQAYSSIAGPARRVVIVRWPFVVATALVLLLVRPAAYAQAPAWQAAFSGNNNQPATGTSQTLATASDGAGNVFVTGSFSGTVGFGSTTLVSAGNTDVFVAKYSPGTSTWAWAVAGGGTGPDQGQGLAVSGGSVYVTGSFSSASSASIAGTALAGAGGLDVFVAQYADNGSSATGRWAVSSGTINNDAGQGIAVSGTSIYVTGYKYSGARGFSMVAGADAGTQNNLDEGFVTKYTNTGSAATAVWTQIPVSNYSGFEYGRGYSVAVSGSNVYVTGAYSYSSPGGLSTDFYRTYLIKYTDAGSTGTPTAFITTQSPGLDNGYAVAVSGSSVYITGSCNPQGTTLLGGDLLVGAGGNDMFVSKYTDDGIDLIPNWIATGGGPGSDVGRALAVSGDNVYVTGYFTSGSGVSIAGTSLTGAGGTDVFVAKYTDAGTYATANWARTGGGTGADAGYGIALTGNGVYVAGGITPASSFGSIALPNAASGRINVLARLTDPVQAQPSNAVAGASVSLTGPGLGAATALTVNGASAPITARTATGFSFTVPAGTSATQGLTVTTPGGSITDAAVFTPLLKVTSISPVTNAPAAPRPNSAVALSFTEPVTAASLAPTATTGLRVFSNQVGGRKAGTVTVSGTTASYTSSLNGSRANFMPGEVVNVTVPGTVRGTGGLGLEKKVVQFTTSVSGTGRGYFQPGADLPVGTGPQSVALGDVDGDGDLDMLSANTSSNTVSVQLNNGSGTFGGSTQVPVGTGPLGVIVGDVDGDGDLDLLTGHAGVPVSVRFNNGSGSFSGTTTTGPYGSYLMLGDVDGDGDLDLATGGGDVVLNNGSGVFSGGVAVAPGANLQVDPWGIAAASLGDMDGDGDLDLVVSTGNGSDGRSMFIGVRFNNGKGVFTDGTRIGSNFNIWIPASRPAERVLIGDVDGDSNLDIILSFSGRISWMRNSGNGKFGIGGGGGVMNYNYSQLGIALGDVDSDGDLDFVAVPGVTGQTLASVALNNGSGVFSPPRTVAVGSNPTGVALGDVDGDGDLDMLTANKSSNTVSVRFNQVAPASLTSISPNVGPVGSTVTLNGTNLTGTTTITFSGAGGPTVTTGFVVNAAGTQITGIVVPGGAATGSVTATTIGGVSNALLFTVPVPAPTVSSFTPLSGPPGTLVAITGTNFTGVSGVSFGGMPTNGLTVVNATTLTAYVPVCGITGPIVVTKPGGTGTSAIPFTVTRLRPAVTVAVTPAGPLGACGGPLLTAAATMQPFAPASIGLTTFENTVAVQADGKILVAGLFLNGGMTRFGMVRLDANGTPDPSFALTGTLLNNVTL